MKSKDISVRRQLLARKNYGRRQMPEFLGDLSLALSQKLEAEDLLSLEETDRLHDHYIESYKVATEGKVSAYRQTWLSSEKDALELKLCCFKDTVADSEVILFSRGFDYCGALKVNLQKALDHVFELLLIDKDSVLFLDRGKTNGFMLDVYEDYIERMSDEIYELVIWGNSWASAISSC